MKVKDLGLEVLTGSSNGVAWRFNVREDGMLIIDQGTHETCIRSAVTPDQAELILEKLDEAVAHARKLWKGK